MNRLLRVELTRLWWRRLPVVAALGLLAVIGVTLFGVHQNAGAAARALAGQDENFNFAVEDWERNGEQMLEQCRADEADEREASGDENLDFGCDQMGPPTVEAWFGQPPSVAAQVTELLLGLSWVLLFAVVVIGCTSTTKELAQRTLGTWLTFVPRRGPVYLSKLLAAALWSLPLTALLIVGVVLGAIAVLNYHGVPDGVTSAEWTDLGWLFARLTLLALVTAAAGAASGFLVRNVAVLIGLCVGYAIAVESILAQLVPPLQRWTVSKNVTAWLTDGTTWITYGTCDETGCSDIERSLTLAQGTAYLGVGAVLLIGLGYLVLRTRDLE